MPVTSVRRNRSLNNNDNIALYQPNQSQAVDGQPRVRQQRKIMPPLNDRPIYDIYTTNRSFVTVADQLQLLGIKNNKFHLLLLNPFLQGVDPHSKNLTPREVTWIIQECHLNIFYYLREVVRIEEQGGGLIPFRMDRGTLAATYCFYNNINFYLMKPRQTGKTVGIVAMLSWAFKFCGPNGDFLFSCYREDLSKKNLRAMKTILGNLPSYLSNMGTTKKDKLGKTIRKTDNIKTYREPAQNNSAMVANCASSEDSAETIGRGFTHIYQFFDEAEFTNYIDTIVKVSGMSFNTASRNAANNGSGYCRIFATTPGDLGNKKACQSALKIVNDALPWTEKFYDEKPENFKALIKHKSKFRVVYIEYDYKSLGLGEDWFIDAVSNVGGDTNKIKREILLQRFSGNSLSPFTMEEIEELDTNQLTPIGVKTLVRGLHEILFYEKPKKGRLYFIGLDPSDGTGGDNYAMTVIDPYTLATVAEFKSPYMTVDDCMEMIIWLTDNYFPNFMLVVERNRNGGSVIERFKSSKLRNHIYSSPKANDDSSRVSDQMDGNGFIRDEYVRNKYFGTNTTPSTRTVMMNILLDAVRYAKDVIRAKYLVEDVKNLIVKNDKIQAAPGEHDDSVMSWLLVMYIYYYGEKLERYGFVKGELPQDVQQDDEFLKLKKLYQNPEIKKQFPTLYAYYMQEKEIHDIKAKEEHEANRIPEKKLGILHQALSKPIEAVPEIDDVMYQSSLTQSRDDWNSRKQNLINKFKALNK